MIFKMMRRAACCATLALGLTAAAMAQEERTGVYVQAGATWLQFDPENSDSSVDTSAITARLGYQYTPMFGVEAEMAFGIDDGNFDYDTSEDNIDFDDNNDGDFADTINVAGDIGLDYLAGVYGRVVWPLTPQVKVSARAGWAYAQVDANARTPGGTNVTIAQDSEDGFSAGVGLTWDFNAAWSARADYTWYDFDDVDTQGATITVGYKF